MKKLLVITIILNLLMVGLTKAQGITKQEKGYFNITELGIFIGNNTQKLKHATNTKKEEAYALSLRNINGWFITNHISAGIGAGFEGHALNSHNQSAQNVFLLFADARYYLKHQNNTFFAYGNVGPSLAIADHISKGLMLGLGFGYKFKIAEQSAMNISLGFNNQRINNSSFSKNRYNGLAIKMGLLL